MRTFSFVLALAMLIFARAEGESEQRLYTLSAWRETPFFGLTIAVIAINGRNRLAIPFRTPPGSYARATDGRGATT